MQEEVDWVSDLFAAISSDWTPMSVKEVGLRTLCAVFQSAGRLEPLRRSSV